MLDILLNIFMLVTGFAVLIKAADLLVQSAVGIALKFNISRLIIGLTIVAFGTSAPELFVNVIASVKGNNDLVIGNVVGSNIANIMLVLGASAAIAPVIFQRRLIYKEILFSLLATLVLFVQLNDPMIDGDSTAVLSRIDGIVLITLFILFMSYMVGTSRNLAVEDIDENDRLSTGKILLFFIGGLLGLALGAKWVVDNAVELSLTLGLSETFIGITIVAIGTSLPEVATSVVAAWKGKPELALGNAVGSNIFNIFWILGVSSLISPVTYNPANNLNLYILIFFTLLLMLFVFVIGKNVISRAEGWIMLIMYAGYMIFLALEETFHWLYS